MDSVFFLTTCGIFLLLVPLIHSTVITKDSYSDQVITTTYDGQSFGTNSSSNSDLDSAGNSIHVPKHRFSSMLSTSKKLSKMGACSFPDDSSGSIILDSPSTKLPTTEKISIPITTFSCFDREPGYYADKDSRVSCKVFHYCNGNEPIVSFICPVCTLFHDEKQLCDFWYNVECNP